MAKSIQEILGYQFLTGTIEAIKTGLPDVLPPAFFSVKESTVGDSGRYTVMKGTRISARRTAYGSSSLKRSLFPVGSQDVKLYHSFEHIDFDVKTFQALRKYDDYQVQKQGLDEVARQVLLFKKVFENTRINLIASMLSKGAIYWDSDGNLLPTSSGAAVTVDYAVPANNQNQLNGVIAASWATATTDIPGHLLALDERSHKDTGYTLKYAFYGRNIPGYLVKNDFVKEYLAKANNGERSADYLNAGAIPQGLFGFTWVPVYRLYHQSDAGTQTSWFGADQVTFMPDIAADVYAMLEGTYDTPTTFEPMASAVDARGSYKPVQGMGAYAAPIQDPPTARMWAFDTCLPVLKVPSSCYIADVTP